MSDLLLLTPGDDRSLMHLSKLLPGTEVHWGKNGLTITVDGKAISIGLTDVTPVKVADPVQEVES